NIPVGAVALVLAWRLLPAPVYGERQGLDPLGVLLLGAGVVCVLLPLVQEQQWESDLKWLLVLAGLALIAVFAAWERRARSPMVRLALFRFRSYALGTAIALLYFAGFTAIFFILTLYLQSGLGYSALGAGFAMTPFAVGSGLGSAAGGRIVARAGRALVVAGLLLVLAGVGAGGLAGHPPPGGGVAWAIAGPLLVAGTGSGLVIAPNQTLTLSEVPPAEGGSAAGVLQTGQRVGSAVGIAAVGYVFFAFLSGSGGDWAAAFRHGLVVILGLVAAALAAALADLAADRRARRRAGSRAGRACARPGPGRRAGAGGRSVAAQAAQRRLSGGSARVRPGRGGPRRPRRRRRGSGSGA